MQVSHDPRYFGIDPAQQMACRNTPFEIEEVKQLALIAALPPHHDPPPPPNESSERESWHADNHEPFFNTIGHKQTFCAAVKKSLFDHLCLLRVAGSKTHGAGVERLIEQLN